MDVNKVKKGFVRTKSKLSNPKLTFDRFGQIFFTLKEVTKLSYKVEPRLLIAVLVLNSVWGLTSVPSFYIEKLLIDRLVEGISNPNISDVLRGIIFLLVLRIGLDFIRNISSNFSGFLRHRLSRRITSELDVLIGQKISSLDLATIEDPEFRDKYNKIDRESGRRAWGLMMPISDIPNYIFGFLSSLGILFLLSPWVVVGIFIFSLPNFFIDKKFIKKDYDLETRLSPLYRIWGWLSWHLTQNRNFMEMKILNLSTYLSEKLRRIQKEENDERINLEKSREKSRLFTLIPVNIFDFGVTLWSGYLVILGKITVGSFQMFLRSLSNAQSNLTGLVSSFLEIYENYIYVADLVWFLNLEPVLESKHADSVAVERVEKIELRNVWFKYRKEAKWILKDVNFEIKSGEKIAIVGENGAGKSTLIKLLGRFYDPQKGEIYINNTSLKEISTALWWEKLAVLFQEFELYPFSVKEAIGFGDVKRIALIDEIKKAAQKTGVDSFVEELPLKYDNPLTPEFDKGVRPSIGQWQRFGIARMLFRKNASLLILDEPTSSVDPMAEEKIFQELVKITKDKILIFVTQRFSTVRIADRILVMHKGKITEQGTHKELLEKDGLYKELFTIQAKGYT